MVLVFGTSMTKLINPAIGIPADLVGTAADSTLCDDSLYVGRLSWFALQVRAKTERYTADILARKGHECFMPTHPADDPRMIRRNKHDLPLFPGYVFCRFDVVKRLPILMTPGVMSVVGTGRIPTPLDDAEIFAIQEAIRRRLYIKPWPAIPFGTVVKISRGPMAGLTGRLASIKNKHRLVLTVTLLQRSVFVEVDEDCLLVD
jgi:transcription antitermination factor NusG